MITIENVQIETLTVGDLRKIKDFIDSRVNDPYWGTFEIEIDQNVFISFQKTFYDTTRFVLIEQCKNYIEIKIYSNKIPETELKSLIENIFNKKYEEK